jgi:Cof subfamily protein (haloacid dehalogenase superfamily)
MSEKPIRFVVSDVDGTLVAPDKSLTPAARAAVRKLREAGVAFTIVSSRPVRGMAGLVGDLDIDLPFAAFNGGTIAASDLRLIEAKRLSAEAARTALGLFDERRIETWAFADDAWWVRNAESPHVERERHTVGFGPTLTPNFDAVIDRIDKIVGVDDDAADLAKAEDEARRRLGGEASAERSQTYYLDVTHPDADKGHAVTALCRLVGLPLEQTAVIGDMTNDLAMFEVTGFSIAMGQADDRVKAAADAHTASNADDGFARAIEAIILPRIES